MNAKANLDTITALDLDSIKQKVMQVDSGEGWTLEQANAVELEYRRFLYLAKMFPHEPTAPLSEVDIFWHHHILDTMKYAADCEQVFGYFLHHVPDSGARGQDDEALHQRNDARTRELYEATFGEAYLRPAQSHAVTAHSAQTAAWCVPTQKDPISAKAAWCVPTQANPAAPQPMSAATAWCVPTQANPASPQPMSAVTAWCVPADGNLASARRAAARTAWCVPTEAKRPAAHDMAWCVPAKADPAPSQRAAANTAWCVPTQGTAGASSPIAANTAWCVPTQRNSALLQGSAVLVSRQQEALNNSRFSPAALAQAA